MNEDEIMEIFGNTIFVSSFAFIWIGWYFEGLRMPLILTYIALWFWGLCYGHYLSKEKEKKKNEIST